jgi:curved DNA-binding protein CbpA
MIPGVDVRKLPLTPTDGYLLTRVNGQATVRDIARETGVFEQEVVDSFEKLVKLNVVTFGSVEEALAALKPPPAPLKAAVLTAAYDPSLLDEACDLDTEQRKRVLDLFFALEDNDYYTLLGIPKDADKKGIKKAYYEVALPMHPDKFFRKNLGSFKPKMEAVFAKLTLAHDTLLDKEKRAEYDVYLKEVAHTKGMEAMLARAMEEARAAQDAMAQTAAAAAPSIPPPGMPSAPPPAPSIPAPPGVDPAVLAARRQALAARLMGGRGRPGGPGAPTPLSPPTPAEIKLQPKVQQSQDEAMDALRRRYDERLSNAKSAQVSKYVSAAEGAIAKNDWVAAANAYRVAMDLAPENDEVQGRAKLAQTEANKILAESYQKQATYDERNERWPEAAKAWVRVAKLKPEDANANERAAFTLWKADGDLREAATFAQAAVALQPNLIKHRVTLANLYMAAGKPALARRELEGAAQVAPQDAVVQAMLKRLPK